MKAKLMMITLTASLAVCVFFGAMIPGEVWNACRMANQYLGLVAFFAVSVRFGMMLGDKSRFEDDRAVHIMFWFGWICVSLLNSSLGAVYYNDQETPANYTSGIRTLLHITAIALAVWWPHPTKYRHLEQT